MKHDFCGLTPQDLQEIIQREGSDPGSGPKAVMNFYRRGIHDFMEMDNLPRGFREWLQSRFMPGLFLPEKSDISSDLSAKYLFRAGSGRVFETVVIPEGKRKTVCVSTQSGCRMGCRFCYTGRSGFRGNLTAGEIINQLMSVPGSADITHVVFMGMGEPMDNAGEVIKACKILSSDWGLAFSPANITVSTVGLLPAVENFLESTDCNLALSLFSPFSEERAEAVPAERESKASDIIELIRSFPRKKKRRFSVAYVMIRDVNDSCRHLDELVTLLKGTEIRVNLLPYHNFPGGTFAASPAERIACFRRVLSESGISSSVRRSRGADISAACGLLASRSGN